MIHKENVKVPEGIQVSKDFLDKFKEIFEQQKKKSKDMKVRITFSYSDDSSDEFKSFSEFNPELLEDSIRTIRIKMYNYEDFSVYVNLDLENSFSRQITIEGNEKRDVREIKDKIEKVVRYQKLGYSWIYSKKRFFMYFFSFLITLLLMFFIYIVLKSFLQKNTLMGIAIALFFPILFVFILLINKIFYWLFPTIDFQFQEKLSDNRKGVKYFLGAIVLALIGNALWRIIEVIVK